MKLSPRPSRGDRNEPHLQIRYRLNRIRKSGIAMVKVPIEQFERRDLPGLQTEEGNISAETLRKLKHIETLAINV